MFSHLHNLSAKYLQVKEFSPGLLRFLLYRLLYSRDFVFLQLDGANHNLHNAQILHDASQVTAFKNKQKSLHSIKRRHFWQQTEGRGPWCGWYSEKWANNLYHFWNISPKKFQPHFDIPLRPPFFIRSPKPNKQSYWRRRQVRS